MTDLPTGTVTFLFTDLEGSTRLWQEYPEAAYYKLSLYPSEASVTSPYIGQRVEATTFSADKPLPKGEYRLQLEAYNDSDQKLAESAHDIKFTVTE